MGSQEGHIKLWSKPTWLKHLFLYSTAISLTRFEGPKSSPAATMKTIQIANLLLFAGAILAAPSKLQEARHERLAKRMATRKHNRPLAVNATSFEDTIVIEPSEHHVSYSSNWAGAVIIGSKITQVQGTFTVPTVKEPSGGSSSQEYGASAWVGIDGDTCGAGLLRFKIATKHPLIVLAAILQTGVDFLVEGTQTAYEAWYEWYPDYSYTFSGFAVKPGDSIRATVIATSTTSGTAKIENLTTGKSTTHSFSGEGSTGTLCETNAEWIVEVRRSLIAW